MKTFKEFNLLQLELIISFWSRNQKSSFPLLDNPTHYFTKNYRTDQHTHTLPILLSLLLPSLFYVKPLCEHRRVSKAPITSATHAQTFVTPRQPRYNKMTNPFHFLCYVYLSCRCAVSHYGSDYLQNKLRKLNHQLRQERERESRIQPPLG